MMLESSRRFGLLETHRVPYRVTSAPAPIREGARLDVVRAGESRPGAFVSGTWFTAHALTRAIAGRSIAPARAGRRTLAAGRPAPT